MTGKTHFFLLSFGVDTTFIDSSLLSYRPGQFLQVKKSAAEFN